MARVRALRRRFAGELMRRQRSTQSRVIGSFPMRAAPRWTGLGWALLVLLAGSAPVVAESWRLDVRGSGADLGETPVVVALKQALPAGAYLVDRGQGKPTSAQVFNDE